MDKNEFSNLDQQSQDQALARCAINLHREKQIEFLPAKIFWSSTLQNLDNVLDTIDASNASKRIQIIYGIAPLGVAIYLFFFTALSFWMALLYTVTCLFIFNKFRNRSLQKLTIRAASYHPNCFIEMWDRGLLGIKTSNTKGVYDKTCCPRWQDIILSLCGWHDLMQHKIMTHEEYLDEVFPAKSSK